MDFKELDAIEEGFTTGLQNAFTNMPGRMECDSCGFTIPSYPGRYPKTCPICGGKFVDKDPVTEVRATRAMVPILYWYFNRPTTAVFDTLARVGVDYAQEDNGLIVLNGLTMEQAEALAKVLPEKPRMITEADSRLSKETQGRIGDALEAAGVSLSDISFIFEALFAALSKQGFLRKSDITATLGKADIEKESVKKVTDLILSAVRGDKGVTLKEHLTEAWKGGSSPLNVGGYIQDIFRKYPGAPDEKLAGLIAGRFKLSGEDAAKLLKLGKDAFGDKGKGMDGFKKEAASILKESGPETIASLLEDAQRRIDPVTEGAPQNVSRRNPNTYIHNTLVTSTHGTSDARINTVSEVTMGANIGRGTGLGMEYGKTPVPCPTGMGPGGICKCRVCGHEVPHNTGESCIDTVCPKCGGPMTRINEQPSSKGDLAFLISNEYLRNMSNLQEFAKALIGKGSRGELIQALEIATKMGDAGEAAYPTSRESLKLRKAIEAESKIVEIVEIAVTPFQQVWDRYAQRYVRLPGEFRGNAVAQANGTFLFEGRYVATRSALLRHGVAVIAEDTIPSNTGKTYTNQTMPKDSIFVRVREGNKLKPFCIEKGTKEYGIITDGKAKATGEKSGSDVEIDVGGKKFYIQKSRLQDYGYTDVTEATTRSAFGTFQTIMEAETSAKVDLAAKYDAEKKKTPDKMVMILSGDFFETFRDDAKRLRDALDIQLTKYNAPGGESVLIGGFPKMASDMNIKKLKAAGINVRLVEAAGLEAWDALDTDDEREATDLAADLRGKRYRVKVEKWSGGKTEPPQFHVIVSGTPAEIHAAKSVVKKLLGEAEIPVTKSGEPFKIGDMQDFVRKAAGLPSGTKIRETHIPGRIGFALWFPDNKSAVAAAAALNKSKAKFGIEHAQAPQAQSTEPNKVEIW